MSPAVIFNIHLALGYIAWLLCFGTYFWPKLKTMDRIEAQRVIATLHSFRFFGLVFLLPGVVGPNLPAGFAEFAAYGDLATGLLAMLALVAIRMRWFVWPLIGVYTIVGAADILVDYYHGVMLDLPGLSGQLGAAYVIPIVYVPLLMITHFTALYLLIRHPRQKMQALGA